MTGVDGALEGLAALDEAALARPWAFRGKPMDVRYALYRTLEDAQERLVEVAARPHPEARRILAHAQRAFGDLRGALVGLPDTLLDRAPSAGAWSVRETLRHVLLVERRYATQTRYAVDRADGDPLRVPDHRLPTPDTIDATGTAGGLLTRIAAARLQTNADLGDLPSPALARPTPWMHYDADVRFRLHRFAAHLVEHTIQCDKIVSALGWHPTEGRLILRRLTALLGELDGLGGPAEVRPVEHRLVERFASIVAG